MIYAASYYHPEHHHGLLVPLTRKCPVRVRSRPPANEADRYVKVHTFADGDEGVVIRPQEIPPVLKLLQPTAALARLYIELGEDAFIEGYRIQVLRSFEAITEWLTELDPETHQTWLTWAKPGEFSHRNLALKLIERYRPDCYGGADVPCFVQTALPLQQVKS